MSNQAMVEHAPQPTTHRAGRSAPAKGNPQAARLDPVYETRRWPYLCLLPLSWLLILWIITKKKLHRIQGKGDVLETNTVWFDGWSPQLRRIREGAASWKALDLIYNHRFGTGQGWGGRIDDFWIGMVNAQAVRNRHKLARIELRKALFSFRREKPIRMISLACGSAQAVLEVIAQLKREGVTVHALLVDIDPSALRHAETMARNHGIGDQIETQEMSVFRVARLAKTFRPHVIEMLGLMDYLNQERAVWLAGQIKDALLPGGIFLTCNVRPNFEQSFLKWVIDWPMIYRTPRQLEALVEQAGFPWHCLYYEPLNVHGVIVALKAP